MAQQRFKVSLRTERAIDELHEPHRQQARLLYRACDRYRWWQLFPPFGFVLGTFVGWGTFIALLHAGVSPWRALSPPIDSIIDLLVFVLLYLITGCVGLAFTVVWFHIPLVLKCIAGDITYVLAAEPKITETLQMLHAIDPTLPQFVRKILEVEEQPIRLTIKTKNAA